MGGFICMPNVGVEVEQGVYEFYDARICILKCTSNMGSLTSCYLSMDKTNLSNMNTLKCKNQSNIF